MCYEMVWIGFEERIEVSSGGMMASIKAYLNETRRPIYSAMLMLPFFLIYHTGTFFLKTTFVNGADAMIMRLLSALSVHSIFASALVLLGCFVVWQIRTRASWKVDSGKLILLYLESLAFALFLFMIFGWLLVHFSRPAAGGRVQGVIEKLVLYCGAGIYEELVFRAFLLGALLLLFGRLLKFGTNAAAIWATVVGALLFSLFHYVGAGSDHFALSSFAQRALGGLYFSVLFVTRGFGVTAASHALYDILVGLILA
jgi:membrane protease YdiL (CAAX protease family)